MVLPSSAELSYISYKNGFILEGDMLFVKGDATRYNPLDIMNSILPLLSLRRPEESCFFSGPTKNA